MLYYFKLWVKIRNRQLIDFGTPLLLAYPLMVVLFLFISETLFQNSKNASYIVIFLAFTVITALSNSKKDAFLKNHFSKLKYYKIKFIENTLSIIPFVGVLIYYINYSEALIVLVLSWFFVFFSIKSKTSFVIPTPFGKKPFEFLLGFRKNILAFIITYLLCFIGIYVGNFNLSVFAILISNLIAVNFYASFTEPVFFVWNHVLNPEKFIEQKIKTAVKHLQILTLPMALLLVCFTIKIWWLLLCVQLVGILYAILFLLAKYENYPAKIDFPKGIILLIALFFPPLTLFLIPYYYKKSLQSLAPILHD